MTGYLIERKIVGWREDPADNAFLDRRFVTVFSHDGALHYPWGEELGVLSFTHGNGEVARTVLVHEPDYQPIGDGRYQCQGVACGQIVHPIWSDGP